MTVVTLTADRDHQFTVVTVGNDTSAAVASAPAMAGQGTSANVLVGKDSTVGHVAAFHFDLSSVPAGATVESVELGLYVLSNLDIDSGEELYAGRITATWDETDGASLTSTLTGKTGAIGAFTTASAYATCSDAALLAIVQGWVDGTFTNHGLAIGTLTNVEADERYSIGTREHGTAGFRPYLTVTYRVPGYQMVI